MKPQNFLLIKRFFSKGDYKGLIVIGVAWLVPGIFMDNARLFAVSESGLPDAAQVVNIEGGRVLFQEGSQRPREARSEDILQNPSQKLMIPGNGSALARLVFLETGRRYAGLMVKAGPDTTDTEYYFPCNARGGNMMMSWRQGSDRGCKEGFSVEISRSDHSQLVSSKTTLAQAIKNFQIVQLDRENSFRSASQTSIPGSPAVLIKPNSTELTFVQVKNTKINIQVTVIIGEVKVQSLEFPQGLIIREGQRYTIFSETEGKLENINREAVLNSPEVQEFLNPANWSSPVFSQPVANEISQQLSEMSSRLPTEEISCTCTVDIGRGQEVVRGKLTRDSRDLPEIIGLPERIDLPEISWSNLVCSDGNDSVPWDKKILEIVGGSCSPSPTQ